MRKIITHPIPYSVDEQYLLNRAKALDTEHPTNHDHYTIASECLTGARLALSVAKLLDEAAEFTVEDDLGQSKEIMKDMPTGTAVWVSDAGRSRRGARSAALRSSTR
jgi:hypothetical protein